MIIALDFDGVVADLHAEWLRRYNADFDDHLTPEDLSAWEISQFVKPEAKRAIYDYLHLPDLYEKVLPVEGAVESVLTLRQAGHRVFFATSCVKGMIDQKWDWLVRHGLMEAGYNAPDLVSVSDKSLVRADVLIDDAGHNLDVFQGARILFTQPWNRGYRGIGVYYAEGWYSSTGLTNVRACLDYIGTKGVPRCAQG